MRWFHRLFVPIFVVLPISIAIWGRNSPSWIAPVHAVLHIFSGAAFILRSRLMAWTLVGGFIGTHLCDGIEFSKGFRSPTHQVLAIFLSCVGHGIAVGLVHDAWVEDQRRRRSRTVIAPSRRLAPMSMELLWTEKFIGTVTDVERGHGPWRCGTFEPDVNLSAELRAALHWMAARSKSKTDLPHRPDERLLSDWSLLERTGRIINIEPLVDFRKSSIAWVSPNCLPDELGDDVSEMPTDDVRMTSSVHLT